MFNNFANLFQDIQAQTKQDAREEAPDGNYVAKLETYNVTDGQYGEVARICAVIVEGPEKGKQVTAMQGMSNDIGRRIVNEALLGGLGVWESPADIQTFVDNTVKKMEQYSGQPVIENETNKAYIARAIYKESERRAIGRLYNVKKHTKISGDKSYKSVYFNGPAKTAQQNQPAPAPAPAPQPAPQPMQQMPVQQAPQQPQPAPQPMQQMPVQQAPAQQTPAPQPMTDSAFQFIDPATVDNASQLPFL